MLQMFLVVLVGVLGLLVISIGLSSPIWIPRLLVILGDIDEWWSPVRTRPQEGEMFVMLRGNPKGPFARIVHSVPGYKLNGNNEFVVDTNPSRPSYLKRNGVSWVGFNRFTAMIPVHYDKWEKLPNNSSDFGLVSKDRSGPAIFFQYFMATEVKAAETVGNFPVNAIVTYTLQIFNPVKAFFLAGGWETQVNAGVQGVVREYISTRDINTLRKEKVAGGNTDLIGMLTSVDPGSLNDRLKQFGVVITAATFVEFDLVGGDAAMSNATRALEIATLEGDAEVMRAEKSLRAATSRAEAIEKEHGARVKAGGAFAGQFAVAETIPQFKGQTLVLGNGTGTAVSV